MSTCPDCETGRNLLAGACRSVFQRGLTGGSAGNMSLRVEGGILATPTGIPFGELTPGNLSLLDETGALVSGPKATKEAPFHLAPIISRWCTCIRRGPWPSPVWRISTPAAPCRR